MDIMVVKILSVKNLGEALLVSVTVDRKVVTTTIKSPLMFEDMERGIFNLLACRAIEPRVVPVVTESPPSGGIVVEPCQPSPPDPKRAADVAALENSFKKLSPGKLTLTCATPYDISCDNTT